MDNKSISKTFKLLSQLMELHNENPFRTKAVANVAYKLDKLPFAVNIESISLLNDTPGIGNSTAQKIETLLNTQSLPELEAYLHKTPKGVLDMLTIKGLGPKKIQTIWKDLAIESVGELYYACNENRLIEAKGFGLKTQEDIKKAIEFTLASQGWFLYAKVEDEASKIIKNIVRLIGADKLISFTGDFRRKNEILQTVDILVEASIDELHDVADGLGTTEVNNNLIKIVTEQGTTFRLIPATRHTFYKQLIYHTGSEDHIKLLQTIAPEIPNGDSETDIYRQLGLAYIEPELREGLNEVVLAQNDQLPHLISYSDLKGSLHNHSTYSDGVHSLAEMAKYCKEELKLDYLGICDHSRTAVYANGLTIDRVQQQWEEVDALNTAMAPFRIFKGIESDILSDGSLDYPDEILAGFDFVVASIHANLKMDEEHATKRLISAIENPYTTILGHPTGRLLLSRSGYPIDYKKVIDACAANEVVIEINANPLRLDLDWRWHRYAIEKEVLLSINPDAHRTTGFLDMKYGVYIARKGGLSARNCLNTFSRETISDWFSRRKKK